MIVKSAIYPDTELRECAPSDLVPVFKIDNGCTASYIYRFDGKLWGLLDGVTTKNVISCIQNGLYSGPELYRISSQYLFVGGNAYIPSCEPFYWLDPTYSTPNGMIKVSCREDGFLEYRRRFSHRERDDAVSCANAVIKLFYNDRKDATERYQPQIIHALPAFYESEVAQA